MQGYDIPLYREKWILKLDLNENLLGPSPKVIEALKNLSEEDIKYYPAYGELIHAISDYYRLDKESVLPTNGADEAISYVFNTFLEPDMNVLSVTPTFAMPKIYAQSIGCEFREVKYKERWIFPLDDFISNIDHKTGLILITTPNSPTGEAISRENLIKIIEKAPNSIILIDETYLSFGKDNFSDLIKKYRNVVLTRSLSKDFALAGLRIGYIAASPEIISYIKRLINPFSVNIAAVKAAIAALNDIEYINKAKEEIIKSKELLYKGLSEFADEVYPSEGNFILADFGFKADYLYNRLLNAGIKVKYYKNHPDIDNCFRISVPSQKESQILLDALQKRDLVIFDMDGVLVDVGNSYRMAIKSTYEFFANKELGFEEIQNAKNIGGLNNDWDLTEFLLKNSAITIPKQKIIDKFQEFYLNKYIQNEQPLIDPEVLNELSNNYDLAVFTGRPRYEANYALEKWGLKDYFSMLVTMEDVPKGYHKPDPWGLNHILRSIPCKKAFYLGDTPDDMTAANKASVSGIGILPPQDKSQYLKDMLKKQGAVLILDNVNNFVQSLSTGMEC